jgi:hypothetical protein
MYIIILIIILPLCAKDVLAYKLQKGYEFITLMKQFTGEISSENEKWAPKSFYIKKNKKEMLTFTEKASSLKIGMSQNEVLNLLGVPTITQKSSSKKVNNVHIIIWDYYLIKKDDNGVNEKFDVYLMLVFSSDKILKEVVFCKGSAYV